MRVVDVIIDFFEWCLKRERLSDIEGLFSEVFRIKVDKTIKEEIETLSKFDLSDKDKAKMIMMYLTLRRGLGKKYDEERRKESVSKYLYKKRKEK